MESARMTSEVPFGQRLALFGLFVSRLMAFCLLYFAPALAYVPEDSGPAPAPVRAVDWKVGERVVDGVVDGPAAETLDPKHRKDRGATREGEHGRGHH